MHLAALGTITPPASPGLQPGPKGLERINSTE